MYWEKVDEKTKKVAMKYEDRKFYNKMRAMELKKNKINPDN